MSFHSFDQQQFDSWKKGLEQQSVHAEWQRHDVSTQRAVRDYSKYHQNRAGYIGPRWQLIKAMLWVETSPGSRDWKTRPMQIGNAGDVGMTDVLTNPLMRFVVPPSVRSNLSSNTIKSDAAVNIQAGLALLHLKFAVFSKRPLLNSGDASRTTEMQSSWTPNVPREKPKTIEPHGHYIASHSREELYISNWLPFTPITLFMRYNLGDSAYARKLEYCLRLISEQHAR